MKLNKLYLKGCVITHYDNGGVRFPYKSGYRVVNNPIEENTTYPVIYNDYECEDKENRINGKF